MPKSSVIRIRSSDFIRLKRYAESHDLNEIEAFGIAVKKLEARKLESEKKKTKEIEFDTCDECKEEIPEDASFCPYCGVEFEDEDEDDDDDEEAEEE